jgi:hypothetical protein
MEFREFLLSFKVLAGVVGFEGAVELGGECPVLVEFALGDSVDVEGYIDLEFSECDLQLFEVDAVLVLVLGGEDDPRGEDGPWAVEVDEAAVGLSVAELFDGGPGGGEVGQQ